MVEKIRDLAFGWQFWAVNSNSATGRSGFVGLGANKRWLCYGLYPINFWVLRVRSQGRIIVFEGWMNCWRLER